MVNNTDKPNDENGGSDKAARAAQRAERRKTRVQKRASRTKKDGSERLTRLCSLETIQVLKDNKGYRIVVSGADKHRSISVSEDQLDTVLKDLEVAINVIRTQTGAAAS